MFFKIFLKFRRKNPVGAKYFDLLVMFVVVVALHTASMVYFEGMSVRDALWLTFTTASTTGYGDMSAQTDMGRLSTVVLMYMLGIVLLARLAGDYIEHGLEKKRKRILGFHNYQKNEHIVVINAKESMSAHFLPTLISELREAPGTADRDIIIVSEEFDEGLPSGLSDCEYVHGVPCSKDVLIRSGAANADFVFILSDDSPESDAKTLQSLSFLKEMEFHGDAIVEHQVAESKSLLLKSGARSVVRAVRGYPELLVRAAAAPGSEVVFETLFSTKGHSVRRLVADKESPAIWHDCVSFYLKEKGVLLIALDNREGKGVQISPEFNAKINPGESFFYALC